MIFLAGNWKMNTSIEEGENLAKEIAKKPVREGVEAILCPPFTHLTKIADAIKNTDYKLGAQNMSAYDNGAHTGEISWNMLKEIGVEYVILGHSECRDILGETDELIREKVIKGLNNNLIPILCVGEKLEDREAGKEKEIVRDQLEAIFKDLDLNSDIIIAYEPIWAIGTGKTATSEEAESMCKYICEVMKEYYPDKEIPVQYGGSVNPSNITELLGQEHISGALVGGASLEADSFLKLIEG